MNRFEFVTRSGAKLEADYVIDDGALHVVYRGVSLSAAAGVNEIANAFLRDHLMRSITGEIDILPQTSIEATQTRGPDGGQKAELSAAESKGFGSCWSLSATCRAD